MKVYKIYPERFEANGYLLTADGKNAIAIDPATPRILQKAQERGLRVDVVLLTHGHFDHIGGCAMLQKSGAKIGCLEEEAYLATGKDNLAEWGGVEISPFSIDFALKEGQKITFCGIEVQVIATPGHTEGSCCYLIEGNLFTGDTLFQGSVGRSDLPTGNGKKLEQSLQKLMKLDNYPIYCGHGEDSTVFEEREYNPYIVI